MNSHPTLKDCLISVLPLPPDTDKGSCASTYDDDDELNKLGSVLGEPLKQKTPVPENTVLHSLHRAQDIKQHDLVSASTEAIPKNDTALHSNIGSCSKENKLEPSNKSGYRSEM